MQDGRNYLCESVFGWMIPFAAITIHTAMTKGAVRVMIPASIPNHCKAMESRTAQVARAKSHAVGLRVA